MTFEEFSFLLKQEKNSIVRRNLLQENSKNYGDLMEYKILSCSLGDRKSLLLKILQNNPNDLECVYEMIKFFIFDKQLEKAKIWL